MDEFTVTTRLWPSGAEIDLGTDSNTVTVPASFNRHAANFVTSMDGLHNYQFLFWNTGKHVTNKRHVRWNFSVGGWGVWVATRWYGTPPTPGPGGPARVRVDPFTLGGNAPISGGTAIDGTASSFAAGAYPFMGNDREIGTASGAAAVVAKDPFTSLQFAEWLQLIWGGDDTGEFVETDTGASPGSSSFFAHGSGPFTVAVGQSADLLATYGNSAGSGRRPIDWGRYVAGLGVSLGDLPIGPGDPGPDDMIRLALLKGLLQRSHPGDPASSDYQLYIESAAKMGPAELKRAKQSVQTSLDLGKAALSAIDAQLKRGGG